MIHRRAGMVAIPALFLLAAGLFFASPSISQEKTDVQKVYENVAGTYEFPYEGQTLVLVFFVKDNRLYGKEQWDAEEVEIKPLDLEKLKFEATVQSNGSYYEIEFIQDEVGKVNKCRLRTAGVEIDGARILK